MYKIQKVFKPDIQGLNVKTLKVIASKDLKTHKCQENPES